MKAAAQYDSVERKKPSFFRRFLAVLLVTAMLISAAAYGGLYIMLKGPSDYAAGLFITAVEDVPFATVLLHVFLSDAEIEECKLAVVVENGETVKQFSVYPWAE